MALLLQVFVFAALPFSLTLAQDCAPGSCVQEQPDETSLMQVKQVVTPSTERTDKDLHPLPSAPQELLNRKATKKLVSAKDVEGSAAIASTEGPVEDAYETSLDSESNALQRHVKQTLELKTAVDEDRRSSRLEAEKQVVKEQQRVVDALAADNVAVEAAYLRRAHVKKQASAKIARAKKNWVTNYITKSQAQTAANEGKWEGQREGYDKVLQLQKEWEEKRLHKAQHRFEDKLIAQKAKGVIARRQAIDHVTYLKKAADEAYVARAKAAAKAVEAHAATKSDESQTAINGAEAIENKMIMHAANRDVRAWDHRIYHEKRDIKKLAHGPCQEELDAMYRLDMDEKKVARSDRKGEVKEVEDLVQGEEERAMKKEVEDFFQDEEEEE